MHNEGITNFIRYWILPKGFQDILIDLIHYIQWYKTPVKINEVVRDTYKGKRCFIIGNGPSLNSQDLSKLANEYSFVVNDFFMTDFFDVINPFGYIVADPVYFNGSDLSIEWLGKLDRKCTNQNLFFPISAAKTLQKHNLLSNKNIYYLDMSDTFNEDTSKINLDITKAVPAAQTVIVMALIVAAYMGFNKIFLIGCDSDWAKYPSAKGGLPHFYDEDNTGTDPEGNPEGWSDGSNWTYENVLNAALIIFKSYRILNNELKKKNVTVYNATNGGFLDVFKRVDYETIFKK
jgi:hypothetical protein